MMLHDEGQLPARGLALRVVDELVQPHHENVQLAAGVHGEDRGEAARAHRDGVHDEGREQLENEHDLVRRAVSGVHQAVVEGTRQLVRRDGDIVDLHHRRRQDGDDAVRADAALHEDRAEAGHESAEFRVRQHHLPIARPAHDPPVGAHMVHALAYLAATQQERAVVHAAHQPVYHRAEGLQLQIHVRLEHDVQRARHHGEGYQRVADELDAARQQPLHDAGRRGARPGADRLQKPAIQLNAVLAVPLVRHVLRSNRAEGARHDHRGTSDHELLPRATMLRRKTRRLVLSALARAPFLLFFLSLSWNINGF